MSLQQIPALCRLQIGAKVWLKTKHFKTGENRNLAHCRNRPWTVLHKLANGVNFRLENTQKEQKVVIMNGCCHFKIFTTCANPAQILEINFDTTFFFQSVHGTVILQSKPCQMAIMKSNMRAIMSLKKKQELTLYAIDIRDNCRTLFLGN